MGGIGRSPPKGHKFWISSTQNNTGTSDPNSQNNDLHQEVFTDNKEPESGGEKRKASAEDLGLNSRKKSRSVSFSVTGRGKDSSSTKNKIFIMLENELADLTKRYEEAANLVANLENKSDQANAISNLIRNINRKQSDWALLIKSELSDARESAERYFQNNHRDRTPSVTVINRSITPSKKMDRKNEEQNGINSVENHSATTSDVREETALALSYAAVTKASGPPKRVSKKSEGYYDMRNDIDCNVSRGILKDLPKYRVLEDRPNINKTSDIDKIRNNMDFSSRTITYLNFDFEKKLRTRDMLHKIFNRNLLNTMEDNINNISDGDERDDLLYTLNNAIAEIEYIQFKDSKTSTKNIKRDGDDIEIQTTPINITFFNRKAKNDFEFASRKYGKAFCVSFWHSSLIDKKNKLKDELKVDDSYLIMKAVNKFIISVSKKNEGGKWDEICVFDPVTNEKFSSETCISTNKKIDAQTVYRRKMNLNEYWLPIQN